VRPARPKFRGGCSSHLFRRDDPAKLLPGAGGNDVQRNAEGTAIIGDPRNDSHVFMSQMHLALARAHNAFVDRARAADVHEAQVFDHAARELRWHYQSVILREFMPRLIGGTLTQQILNGDRRYYRPRGEPFIPLEFADGAYRYGRSQIRHAYRINRESAAVPIFPDLMGFRPVRAEHRVDWTLLFDRQRCAPAQRAKKLDGRLVRALIALPAAMTAATDPDELHSLATRDLERGQGVGLPSGEAVARLLGETPLSAAEIGAADAGWPARRRSGITSCAKPTCGRPAIASGRSAAASSARCSSGSSITIHRRSATRRPPGRPSARS
jgi:hypothetical protein